MSAEEPTVICLIRHGETDWNATGRLQGREDIVINEAGREQALALARYLNNEKWDLIISSPLKRALESAQIIAACLSLQEPVIIEELRERNYGEASGLLPGERHDRFPDGKYPGQEEFEHLRIRAMDAVGDIIKSYPGRRIVVISHGAWINSVLYTISSGEFGSFKTRLKNACLNLLSFEHNHWSVIFYNKTVEDLIF